MGLDFHRTGARALPVAPLSSLGPLGGCPVSARDVENLESPKTSGLIPGALRKAEPDLEVSRRFRERTGPRRNAQLGSLRSAKRSRSPGMWSRVWTWPLTWRAVTVGSVSRREGGAKGRPGPRGTSVCQMRPPTPEERLGASARELLCAWLRRLTRGASRSCPRPRAGAALTRTPAPSSARVRKPLLEAVGLRFFLVIVTFSSRHPSKVSEANSNNKKKC